MKLENSHLIVKKAKNGKGLFSKKNFKRGEKIFTLKGKIITNAKFMEYPKKIRDNCFRFNGASYLSPEGKFGDFINHSCTPNCGIKKSKGKLFIESLKKIKPGEELVFDYSTILASDDFWKMKCNCGEKNCRKVIEQFKLLPINIQKKYLSLKTVPKYILKNYTI
ncbi:hypothetical protein COU59_02665 [Candidatus Pacearchaeota archaeon CG10_big_fil_rev_8_21_14_0_10_34_12]|nr:MAG: hypothetical protein COU59_02665 [Candidatus Pacearchaeota archaeon CG10_big_fil_rev_8_21_14_0_10_34_12]